MAAAPEPGSLALLRPALPLCSPALAEADIGRKRNLAEPAVLVGRLARVDSCVR